MALFDNFTFDSGGAQLVGYNAAASDAGNAAGPGAGSFSQHPSTSGSAVITSDGTKRARCSTTASSCLLLASGAPASANYQVLADLTPQAASLNGFNVRLGARTDPTNANYYCVAFGGSSPVVGLRRIAAGAATNISPGGTDFNNSGNGFPAGRTFAIRFTVQGTTLTVDWIPPTVSGTQTTWVGATAGGWTNLMTVTDSTYGGGAGPNYQGAALGFNAGLSSPNGGSDTTGIMVDNFAAQDLGGGSSITVTGPVQYQIFQRDSTGKASIPISGSYVGSPTAIQASFNGGPMTTIVGSPSGGTFTGTLTGQAGGQGMLTVQFSDGSASTTVSTVGIGDVFVVAGQSNAVGRGDNAQAFSHATLKATVYNKLGTWALANDVAGVGCDSGSATGSAPARGNQAAWGDTGTNHGSCWPLVATKFLADQSVPMAFITCAYSGAGLLSAQSGLPLWYKGAPGAAGTNVSLYQGLLNQVANSGVNGVKAILWHQGEADAKAGTDPAAYLAALQLLANNLAADLAAYGSPKMVVASVGGTDTATAAEVDGVRQAQRFAWSYGGNILPGPTCYSTDLTSDMATSSPYYSSAADSIHFRTNQALTDLASRWWAALKALFYGGSAGTGRGPQVIQATLDATRTYVDVQFTASALPLSLSAGIPLAAGGTAGTAFEVDVGGISAAFSSVAIKSGTQDTVRITLASPAPAGAPVTVSLGVLNNGGGRSIPVDASANSLPAEPFYGVQTPPFVVFRRSLSALGGKSGRRQSLDASS